MSAATARRHTPADPLLLAHDVAQLAALLPGADNAERQTLQAIHEAIAPWRLGQASPEEVRIQVALLANAAFIHGPDLSHPECWMLGLISSLLGACRVFELKPFGSEASRVASSDLAEYVATEVIRTFVALAHSVPASTPLGVSPKLYGVVGEDVARRIEGLSKVAMLKTFGTRGTLQ